MAEQTGVAGVPAGGVITVQGVSGGIAQLVTPVAPAAANILSGVATTSTGTVITIPANRVWVGSVTVSGSLALAAAGVGANANVRATVTGATAAPAAGDFLRVELDLATQGAATTGAVANSATQNGVCIVAGTSAATIQLNFTNATTASCSANGVLL
jgi:hypothetical protein